MAGQGPGHDGISYEIGCLLAARTARLRRRATASAALALRLLAGKLPRPADGLGLLAGALLGRFFVIVAELHLAEDAFALHLFLQSPQGLIDIVIANDDLHELLSLSVWPNDCRDGSGRPIKPRPRPVRVPHPGRALTEGAHLVQTGKASTLRVKPRDVAHLAALARFRFAVEMDGGIVFRGRFA